MGRTTILWRAAVVFLAFGFVVFFPPGQRADGQSLLASEDLASSEAHPIERFAVSGSVTSIAEAFNQTGIDFFPEDRVTAFPDPSLGLGSIITVKRALPITVKDGRRAFTLRTWAGSIDEVLSQNKLELGKDDRISPSVDTPLSSDLVFTITRVARTVTTEKETIRFAVEERDDPTALRGERRVLQEGRNGERTKQFLLIRENGDLVSRTLLSSTITANPQNRVVLVGSKLRTDPNRTRVGVASHYGEPFFGSGNIASHFLPRGTRVLITNLNNGKRIEGVINDWMARSDRVIDLSPELFQQLGAPLGQGLINNVRVEVILN